MSSTPIAAAPAHILDLARRVLEIEADAVRALADRLGDAFTQAVGLILASRGRVIVSGVGKSGHIGRKFAATLASTGTPAYFVHAAEAAHGDLGMITADDVLIALSYSGSGEELLKIVPLIKRQGARLIALTGNPDSPLAREADVHLGAVREEACPLNLAPTASTTAALALTDALAVALLDARGFGADDFARSHPGGALGRRLLTHVSDVMRSGPAVPRVAESALLADALMEMTRAGMGMTAIVGDGSDRIIGIYTDGDLRRSLASGCDFGTARVADVMSRGPRTIAPEALAVQAAEMMERLRISQLLVADPAGRLVGALNHHDLMLAKVI